MSKGQYRVALAVLAVAGLLGGMLGSWILPRPAAWAQEGTEAAPVVEEVRARRFVVVDEEERERAVLGEFEDGGVRLRL